MDQQLKASSKERGQGDGPDLGRVFDSPPDHLPLDLESYRNCVLLAGQSDQTYTTGWTLAGIMVMDPYVVTVNGDPRTLPRGYSILFPCSSNRMMDWSGPLPRVWGEEHMPLRAVRGRIDGGYASRLAEIARIPVQMIAGFSFWHDLISPGSPKWTANGRCETVNSRWWREESWPQEWYQMLCNNLGPQLPEVMLAQQGHR